MKQLFLMVNEGKVKHIETPKPRVKENYVIVETLYSAVSAGTERSLTSFGSKNLIQKALEKPDEVKKVLEKMATDGILTTLDATFLRLNEPMPIGYSGMGKVLEVGQGVSDVNPGDMVAMAGQAYHSEINRVNRNLIAKIPEKLKDKRQAAFCALGAIALQGIHQAKVEPGETVAVIGLGLLGHITARILNAYGCDVIGYDVTDKSMPGTKLKAYIHSAAEDAADLTFSLTKGLGVDKVIITAATTSNAPMDLAAAIARERAIISMIGVTQMMIDRRPYYDKELTFTVAKSYGPGRYDSNYEEKGIDYPIGLVRFSEGRNLEEFIRLLETNRLSLVDLITHEIEFSKADEAYELITENKRNEKYVGIILKYSDYEDKFKSKVSETIKTKRSVTHERINIGLIGAGNFAKNTLLPYMKKTKLYQFQGLATTGGVGTAQVKDVFEFQYATNDYHDLLNDEDIHLVVISTQHDTHAKFVVEALKANKHVYCEKPLCLTLEELHEIKQAYDASKGELFVGFNRRHAPMITKIKSKLSTSKLPAMYDYIANAGQIPNDHWAHDEHIGGGRILGEAIHFIDVIQYLDDSTLTSLNVNFVVNNAYPKKDNALLTLEFSSGAIANVLYTSMGSKKYPKEKLKVFSNGQIYEMNNYVKLNQYGTLKRSKLKLKQDKGFFNEYRYIFDVLRGSQKSTSIEQVFSMHEHLISALDRAKKHLD